jgi:hypothetical protein
LVKNVPKRALPSHLREIFSYFGTITCVNLLPLTGEKGSSLNFVLEFRC